MLSTVLAGGAILGWWLPRETWVWNAALAFSEPWRHFTAAWVHLSTTHLLANLAAALVVALFGRMAGCTGRDALAWLVAWPLSHASLMLQPGLRHYAGLSGVLHAGVAIACLALITRARGPARWIGAAVFAGLLVKLWAESPLSAGVQNVPEWPFPVVVLAHTTGAVAGLLCALVAWVTSPKARDATIT